MFICLNKTIPQKTLVTNEVLLLEAMDEVTGRTCLDLRSSLRKDIKGTAQQMGALLQKLRTRGLVESVGGRSVACQTRSLWVRTKGGTVALAKHERVQTDAR